MIESRSIAEIIMKFHPLAANVVAESRRDFSFDREIRGFQGEHRWLSNFPKVPVIVGGMKFESPECAYQAFKCRFFVDVAQFLGDVPSGHAKRLGRKIAVRKDWLDVRDHAMATVRLAKYANPEQMEKLRSTAGHLIVEDNTWKDTYWGVCDGVGENRLGKIDMAIRDRMNEIM